MHPGRKIFLIGFMGSGKSTSGKKLADRLGWSFIDLDERIEERAGMKIPEIFANKGEAWFREMEATVLHDLAHTTDLVVSTGGGAPCYDDNMDFMLHSGLTVYLKLTPEQLKNRLQNSKTERPLLKNINEPYLTDYISQKLSEREKWYSRAAITVDGFETDISSLISLVRHWKEG
jgi:shikimate kinase